MKRPAFQFYPADWRKDNALQLCSIAARGLWWEMICLMHEARPYGHLVAAGKKLTAAGLARLVGEARPDVERWLTELQEHEVFSVRDDGVIYCRRMVRDEDMRKKWRARQDKKRDKSRDSSSDEQRDNERDTTQDVTPDVTASSPRSSASALSSSSEVKASASDVTPAPAEKPEAKSVSTKINGEKPPPIPGRNDVHAIDRLGKWLSEHGVLKYPAPPGTIEGSDYGKAHDYVTAGLRQWYANGGKPHKGGTQ